MNDQRENAADAAVSGWDSYWRGTAAAEAWSAGGARHPGIAEFWQDLFAAARDEGGPTPRLLDVAAGNGAVLEAALGVFGEDGVSASCVDRSAQAISNITQRFPGINGLVCDARSIPLESGTFDIVTSQFGIEYAGPDAVAEAFRLLAPGGQLALVMHYSGGAIHEECVANRDAVRRLQSSRFIPLVVDMFRAGFAAVRGADREPYDAAAAQLAPALSELEAVIEQQGAQVAGGTLVALHDDVGRIHGRMPHYDPEEVLGWLQRMDTELGAYAERMESMIGAGNDEAEFFRLLSDLQSRGAAIVQAGPLRVAGLVSPLAWALQAKAPDPKADAA